VAHINPVQYHFLKQRIWFGMFISLIAAVEPGVINHRQTVPVFLGRVFFSTLKVKPSLLGLVFVCLSNLAGKTDILLYFILFS
jgi:hypothetical protein